MVQEGRVAGAGARDARDYGNNGGVEGRNTTLGVAHPHNCTHEPTLQSLKLMEIGRANPNALQPEPLGCIIRSQNFLLCSNLISKNHNFLS